MAIYQSSVKFRLRSSRELDVRVCEAFKKKGRQKDYTYRLEEIEGLICLELVYSGELDPEEQIETLVEYLKGYTRQLRNLSHEGASLSVIVDLVGYASEMYTLDYYYEVMQEMVKIGSSLELNLVAIERVYSDLGAD